jgi:tetratricopeptide (TPR) repeat protein
LRIFMNRPCPLLPRHATALALLCLSAFAATAQSPGLQNAVPPLSSGGQKGERNISLKLVQAQNLYRSGQLVPAMMAYNAIAIGGGPDEASAYAGLARVYLKENDPAHAFSVAQKGLALDPDLPAAHTALGEVYFRQGRFPEAEHEFQTSIGKDSRDARALLGMSRIYRATSNYRSAQSAIVDARSADPDDPDVQLAWLSTLDLHARIAAIRDYLARDGDTGEGAQALRESLTVLQDQELHSSRVCRLTTPLASTEAKLLPLLDDPGHARGYGLKVKFNDVYARLLLDTGVGGIVVNGSLARKAGIQRVSAQQLAGVGDAAAAKGYVGFARFIQVGALQFENCYVDVVEKKSSLGEEGLIGADVFSHFLVDINFPDRKFTLSELPARPDQPPQTAKLEDPSTAIEPPLDRFIPPGMESYSKVFRFEHLLLIPTSIDDHPARLFVIDTGAFDNTITPDAAREATKIHGDGEVTVSGLSGKVNKVYETSELTLTFGHLKQKRTIVAFDLSNLSNSAGTEISGALGFGMLGMLDIKIDYRDGLVDFRYDPYRFH